MSVLTRPAAWLAALLLIATGSAGEAPAPAPDATFEAHVKRVAPLPHSGEAPERTPGQLRAVVLIHGLSVHPLIKSRVERATYRSWQESGSPLVERLAALADVYALAYTQNAAVDEIADLAGLPWQIARLRRLGYQEIVLVGHSAGGLIARHLVEDHPDLGVTRVIQVCPPNTGSLWAHLPAVRSNQLPFLASMSCEARKKVLAGRTTRRIPPRVEFACVLGSWKLGSDGVVLCRNQWSEDLQEQGIPAFPLHCNHYDAMLLSRTAELLAQLTRDRTPRWDANQVAAARKKLLE